MIHTNKQPNILNIKPIKEVVQEVEKNEVVDDEFELPPLNEEEHTNAMFEQAQAPKPKPKKKRSERQLAHMARMREAAKQKRERIALQKRKDAEELKQLRAEKLRRNVETNKETQKAPVPQPISNIQNIPKPVKSNTNNQEYMQDFFSNLNMFMDSYNKINQAKSHIKQPVQVQTKQSVASKTAPAQPQQKFTMLNPYVKYRGVRNPF